MANYFVINNKFKPYSFDELIKPYQLYGQAYEQQEAMLDLAREKEFSPDYLDQTQDAAAYNMYNTASQELKAVSDELATKGLSAGLRSKIRTTARDYKRTMDTLNEAQARLYAERDRRAKAGDDYVYQQDNLRIGDFLNGATPNQRSASLSNITKDIAAEFSSRAKGITRDTWNKVFANNGNVIGGYFDVTTETGLTGAQLDSILADETTWNRIISNPTISKDQKDLLQGFRDIISAKKQSIDFDNYGEYEKGLINSAIVTGAHGGLGTTVHDYKQDRNFESPELRYRKERDEAEDKRLQEQIDIESGKKPFYKDPATGERWYTNSKNKTIWSTDKDGRIVTKPTTATNLGKESKETIKIQDEVRKQFPRYFEALNDTNSTFKASKRDKFNEEDATQIKYTDLSEAKQRVLSDELFKYGLSLEDVTIYKDERSIRRNRYKITVKTTSPSGTTSIVPIGEVDNEGNVTVDGGAVPQTATPRSVTPANSIPGLN